LDVVESDRMDVAKSDGPDADVSSDRDRLDVFLSPDGLDVVKYIELVRLELDGGLETASRPLLSSGALIPFRTPLTIFHRFFMVEAFHR
jgi:hypothetical protein